MPTQRWTGLTFKGAPGHDRLAAVLGMDDPDSYVSECTFDANGADWGLKLANNTGSLIVCSKFIGGRERAVDIVRGSNIEIRSCTFDNGQDRRRTRTRFSPFKHCDVGVKAGAQVSFVDCVLDDILIGDYSIYDNPTTCQPTVVKLSGNCRNRHGGPVVVRMMNGQLFSAESACVIHVPSPLWRTYYSFNRKFGDTRKG